MQQYGPVYGTWMYPYERFNSWICKRALNRAFPEVTVVETYRVSVLGLVYLENGIALW